MCGAKANFQITAFMEVPGTYVAFSGMKVEEREIDRNPMTLGDLQTKVHP